MRAGKDVMSVEKIIEICRDIPREQMVIYGIASGIVLLVVWMFTGHGWK